MNAYQIKLFNDLEALVASHEAFYFQQFESNGHIYRIYNYRLASYSDFLNPGALECRGVMFEVDNQGNPLRLAALPMEKFFNLNENPFTIGLDLTQVDEILLKADGSLMSSYIEDDKLKLKSKGSISSEQAIAAMNWLKEQRSLCGSLLSITNSGYTVNLEWCSPIHRIVISYPESHLKVLNVRCREDGEYLPYNILVEIFGEHNVIERVQPKDPVGFIQQIPEMQDDIEGYVIRLKSGQRVKIKTNKYLSLHCAKESITNPRRLFEAIVEETVDDLRSMFYTDSTAMALIDEMQKKVDHIYNSMVNEVENFYQQNKDLSRKDYALKAQQQITPLYFSRAMNLYLGKNPDYKNFLKGKWKDLGIRDEELVDSQ